MFMKDVLAFPPQKKKQNRKLNFKSASWLIATCILLPQTPFFQQEEKGAVLPMCTFSFLLYLSGSVHRHSCKGPLF